MGNGLPQSATGARKRNPDGTFEQQNYGDGQQFPSLQRNDRGKNRGNTDTQSMPSQPPNMDNLITSPWGGRNDIQRLQKQQDAKIYMMDRNAIKSLPLTAIYHQVPPDPKRQGQQYIQSLPLVLPPPRD